MEYEYYRDRKEYFTVGACASPVHFHRSIEILYCIEKPKRVYISGVYYTLQEGEALFVPPCAVHYFPKMEGHVSLCSVFPVVYTDMWEKNTGGGATPHPIICDKALALDIYEHLKKLEGCDNDLKKNGIYTYVLGAIIEASELFEYRRFENSDFALRVIEYLQKNYDKNLSLDEVSRELGYNRCYFSTLFNKNFRVGFRMYLNTMRINNSLSMLDSHSTSEIARRVGFESVQVYYSNFRRVMGCTPTQYMMQKSSSNN